MSHASFKDIERDVDADDGRSVTDGDIPSSRNRRRSRPPSRYSSQHFGHESYDAYDLEESAEYDGGVKPARTVDEKHDALNAMFGFKPWKSMDKPFYDPSTNLKPVSPSGPSLQKKSSVPKCEYISYVIWLFLGGLWISLAYFIAAGLLYLTIVGRRYGPVCVTLAKYYFWPFNSFIIRENDFGSEKVGIVGGSKSAAKSSCSAGYVFWAFFTWPIATVVHSFSFIICWMSVVFIPMAKVNQVALGLLFEKNPEDLQVIKEYPGPGADVLLCTFSASNINYYRYTVGGMNIVLVNLLPFVFLCLIFSYLPYLVPSMELPSTVMFTLCSLSVIPCSYYIGTALSSFSAQTNFALGALLNATFGSLIEIILYTLGIAQGTLNDLVQAAVTGTILAMLLLLPGLSMIVGGIKHTQQRFNPAVAGVSSVLLLLAVIGAFTPTIFYQIYGHYTLSCDSCTPVALNATTLDCNDCLWKEVDMDTDPVFLNAARPLMYVCAGILPISYIVGLIFTLKTHAHILEDPDIVAEEEAPIGDRWSKTRCIIILLLSTFLYSLIAEELVNTLEPTIELLGISQTFAGLTLLAVIPSVAEFANGISFALNNNFALSLEIGNSAAVQVVLIQMPVLIVISVFFAHGGKEAFTLIFPALDVLAVVFAVIIVNYISIDGKANYFLGSALVISYTLIVVAFYFVPDISPDSLSYATSSLNPHHQ